MQGTISRNFAFPAGEVNVTAKVTIDGDELILEDFKIFPKEPDVEKVPIGREGIAAIKNQLLNEAKEAGFTQMTIRGTRVTGANPMRHVSRTFPVRQGG